MSASTSTVCLNTDLPLDSGHPSYWLAAARNACGVVFCMRVEKAGKPASLACASSCARAFFASVGLLLLQLINY